jgi:hypothetical protein
MQFIICSQNDIRVRQSRGSNWCTTWIL